MGQGAAGTGGAASAVSGPGSPGSAAGSSLSSDKAQLSSDFLWWPWLQARSRERPRFGGNPGGGDRRKQNPCPPWGSAQAREGAGRCPPAQTCLGLLGPACPSRLQGCPQPLPPPQRASSKTASWGRRGAPQASSGPLTSASLGLRRPEALEQPHQSGPALRRRPWLVPATAELPSPPVLSHQAGAERNQHLVACRAQATTPDGRRGRGAQPGLQPPSTH